MDKQIRLAEIHDVESLVELMDEFYKESGFKLDINRSRIAFQHVISNPSDGYIWIFEKNQMPIGYMALTLCFSMEYGGKNAFLDDLFIKKPFRNKGLGTQALKIFFETCETLGVFSVLVETGRENTPAKALYKHFGFKNNNRLLLTSRLREPL